MRPSTRPAAPGRHIRRPIVIATLPARALSQAGRSATPDITATSPEPLSGWLRKGRNATGPDVDLRQPVHSKPLGDLAAGVGVVGDQPHEYGLASMELHLAIDLSREFTLEHVGRPSIEALLDDRPGRLECGHELAGVAGVVQFVFPSVIDESGERCALGARLLADMAEPVGTDRGGVRGDRPDRPQIWSGPQRQLFRR